MPGSVRVLVRITLPLLLPALGAAAGLAVALSMGELGATVMVYPATWKTLPVTIFGLTDRGQVFQAAASTTLLLAVTLLALMVLGRIRDAPHCAEPQPGDDIGRPYCGGFVPQDPLGVPGN